MATGGEVLGMLIPNGGWVISADDFESIRYDEGVTPLTKKQFIDGFAAYDSWKAEQDSNKAIVKTQLLARLGITAEEASLLK
jgi:hypothetical protein